MDTNVDLDWKGMLSVEMGISHLSPEEQARTVERFGASVFERVYRALWNACPPDKRDAFKMLVESSHADVSRFINEHIPNATHVAEEVLDKDAGLSSEDEMSV